MSLTFPDIKNAKPAEFAAYVRNETSTAIRLKIPFGTMEAAPKMTPEQHRRLIASTRRRYSSDSETEDRVPEPPPPNANVAKVDGNIELSNNW